MLSLEIVILVMEKDSSVSNFWRPLYQPLDVILSQDHNQIVALLEYIQYDFQPQTQFSRMVGLSHLLLKSSTANSLIGDYAACLEMRSEASQVYKESSRDPGVLIMQLLIDNISRPAPNITHLLLILDILDKLLMPDVNAWLHELGFQLLYELCVDPLTSSPTMDLLCTKKYQFYVKHLSSIGIAPLPKSSEIHRTSSLHQNYTQQIQRIAIIVKHAKVFLLSCMARHMLSVASIMMDLNISFIMTHKLESPGVTLKSSQFISSAGDILTSPTTSGRGVYYSSERGDRLIDLTSLRDRLWQIHSQSSTFGNEAELSEIKEAIQQLLRWG
ncbi:hypothetical protein OROHE_019955 [Orobanche hederae]